MPLFVGFELLHLGDLLFGEEKLHYFGVVHENLVDVPLEYWLLLLIALQLLVEVPLVRSLPQSFLSPDQVGLAFSDQVPPAALLDSLPDQLPIVAQPHPGPADALVGARDLDCALTVH